MIDRLLSLFRDVNPEADRKIDARIAAARAEYSEAQQTLGNVLMIAEQGGGSEGIAEARKRSAKAREALAEAVEMKTALERARIAAKHASDAADASARWEQCETLAAKRDVLGGEIHKGLVELVTNFKKLAALSAEIAATAPTDVSDVNNQLLCGPQLDTALRQAISKHGWNIAGLSESDRPRIREFDDFVREGSKAILSRKARP